MNGSASPHADISNDPARLPAAERDYYRATWGFDPVGDCRSLGGEWHGYEACVPLENDPPLHAAGVTACARVDWQGGTIHNRIVFRRGGEGFKEAVVECTHTLVHAGPAASIPTFAMDAYTTGTNLSRTDREWLARAGGPVPLPPWEHFAALKSYVGAVAEVGIAAMFRATLPTKEETSRDPGGMPDLQDTPEAPFGFNSAMQAQILRALAAVAPAYTEGLRRDLARELLDTAPAAWVIKRWELLAPIYPLTQIFSTEPTFFINWLGGWIKEDPSRSLPYVVMKDLGDFILGELFLGDLHFREWAGVVRAWPPELVTEVCRSSDLLDAVQKYLFGNPAHLARAKTAAPAIPWDQLRLEWQAREKVKDKVKELSGRMENLEEDPDNLDLDLSEIPEGEDRTQAPLCSVEIPQEILDLVPQGITPAANHGRLSRFSYQLKRYEDDTALAWLWLHDPKRKQKTAQMTHYWAEKIASGQGQTAPVGPPPTQADRVHTLRIWARHPLTSVEVLQGLVSHWNFIIRLAVAAHPNASKEILEQLAKDIQPSVRAIVKARLQRGGRHIIPKQGEILTAGEILWLLVWNEGAYLAFAVSKAGNGTQEYRKWLRRNLQAWIRRFPDSTGFEKHLQRSILGRIFLWRYWGGFISEEEERGNKSHYLPWAGLQALACGTFPCMFVGYEGFVGYGPEPFR